MKVFVFTKACIEQCDYESLEIINRGCPMNHDRGTILFNCPYSLLKFPINKICKCPSYSEKKNGLF